MGPFSDFLLSLAKEESLHYNIDLMSGMFVLRVRALNINSSCTFILCILVVKKDSKTTAIAIDCI